MNRTLKKYKFVLIPLLLVLVFDFTLLIANYFISAKLETSAVNINIAGRQRMLSQKIAKALVAIHYNVETGSSIDELTTELKSATDLFDKTLTAFIEGGNTTSPDGKRIILDRTSDLTTQETLTEAAALWRTLYQKISHITPSDLYDHSKSHQVIDYAMASNLKLLSLMNRLTNQLESDAKEKTYLLRELQTVIAIMVLLSFVLATLRLYRRENYYNSLMEKSTDVVLGVDVQSGLVTFMSNSVYELLGYDDTHYLDSSASQLFTSKSKIIFYKILEHIQLTEQLDNERCEIELLTHDGHTIMADMVMQLTKSEDTKSTELSIDLRDITERKEAEMALADLAHRDTLTGLPNRRLFHETAEHALKMANRHQNQLAIMFIDLDGFKAVNDRLGHDAGDEVLIEVSKRIADCLRASDNVSRVGGDEFLILLEEIPDENGIKIVANKVIATISKPIIIASQECFVGASIGVSIYPDHGDEVTLLIKRADNAMYKIKNSGKNSFGFA